MGHNPNFLVKDQEELPEGFQKADFVVGKDGSGHELYLEDDVPGAN